MTETAPAINPYDGYRFLRDAQPIAKLDEHGPWQVSRHSDVHQVLRDHQTFSSVVSTRPVEDRGEPTMLFSDPPVHQRLRKLVSVAFKPSHIERQAERIEARARQLVSAIPKGETIDLVNALAAPLPVMVIAEMLGVEDGDMATFKQWSDAIFSNIGEILFGTPSPEAEQAALEMNQYFLEQIANIRRAPQSHLLGRLIETTTDDGHLNDEELLSFCRLLLIAGNETTTGLITASAKIFHELPQTFDALQANPNLGATFVEETLRYYSPFSATARRTTRDVTLSDVHIPKGELVIPLIASANRDDRVFDQPDVFCIDRDPSPHLALGFGIHFCLGAHLARLEGKIAVQVLTEQFKRIRLTEPEAAVMGGLGGPKSLPVVFT
jgi:cytochrome P450